MPHRARHGLVDEIGLVERVLARRVVVIGVERERCLIRRYRSATERGGSAGTAGKYVLVSPVVVGVVRPVPDGQSVAEIVVDDGHAGLHVDMRIVVKRTAEECREIAIRRERRGGIEARRAARKPLRGIAAIGQAVVMIGLIAQLDRGIVGRLQRDRGIEAIAFEVAILAERIAVFIKRIQTHRDVFIDRLSCVEARRACRRRIRSASAAS